MAKGSVRKKGKKWYYRFYVEDASGKMVQKEYAGTESKSETEKLLRKALEDYEDKKFVAKADNLTVGELLDMWAEEVDLFSDDEVEEGTQPISHEDYERLIKYLEKKNPPAILPIQIAYYAGLRIGETCGLTWQDINLEDQCLTIKRSIRYDGAKHKNVIGTTKRKKVRIVDFGDTLTEILKAARREQLKSRMQYGELYHRNYYKEVHVKNRVYYEYYHLDGTQEVPADYKEISFVCLRPDGSLELPSTLGIVCRSVSKKLEGFEDFHFHQLRHTYTSNLLSNGAAPKDVQELLGHSDVSTTMNIYAHSTRKAKRDSARLLDKVASNA